jgi:protein-tyrosine-phosphatase
MTEAIARQKAPLRLRFTTAGIEPQALDRNMVAYMAKRGFDVSRPRPRSLADVGPLDDFYVVVLLSKKAEDACPPLPYKTIALTWDIHDPTTTAGTAAEVEAGFARTYAEIDVKLSDLIAAMLGNPDEPTQEIT